MTKFQWFQFYALILVFLIYNFFRFPVIHALINILGISVGAIFLYIIYKIIEKVLLKFEIKPNKQQKDAILCGVIYITLTCQIAIFLWDLFLAPWFIHYVSQIFLQQ